MAAKPASARAAAPAEPEATTQAPAPKPPTTVDPFVQAVQQDIKEQIETDKRR
jgi:hypothetical protein